VTLEIEIDMDRQDNIGYLTRQLEQILEDLGLPPEALRAAANRMEVARLEAEIE
jgi:chemotaxis regulatin CheY-phosphate phosphatase CheZ